jgi:hypothetical protein
VAEAIRRYAAEEAQGHSTPSDMGASRRIQIARDLARTASERIREAETESVVAVDPVQPLATERSASPSIKQPRHFATYDDFVAWRHAQAADGRVIRGLQDLADIEVLEEIRRRRSS